MLKKIKRVLAVLSACIIASAPAASVHVRSEAGFAASYTLEDTYDRSYSPAEINADTKTYVTDKEALSAMTEYASDDRFTLFVNEETAVFAIEDKLGGHIWWSGYYNTDPGDSIKLSRRNSVISINVLSTESNTVESAVRSYDTGVDKRCERLADGAKLIFGYRKYGIEVPLEIRLGSDGSFSASVEPGEIRENRTDTDPRTGESGYRILGINILGNMGAAGYGEEGMIIVPDGSGAVIEYNNGSGFGDANTFSADVYGSDAAVGKLYAGDVTKRVTLPVMASLNRTKGAGLVMTAVSGDTCASEHAMVTGQNVTDLNTCWFGFTLRTRDSYYMGSGNAALTVCEPGPIRTGRLEVNYRPVYGEELSYTDAAAVCRDHLINDLGVAKKTVPGEAPFYLTLMGGTLKTQSVFGFPADLKTAATGYRGALGIIKRLEDGGIGEFRIIYEDFSDSGINNEVASGFECSSLLGGNDGYAELSGYITERGYKLFPDCEMMFFDRSGSGYSFTLNSSKQVTKAYATQSRFDLAYGTPSKLKNSGTILSPRYFPDIFDRLASSFSGAGQTGISVGSSAKELYSDFSRTNNSGREYILREDTALILRDGYKRLKDSGLEIMTDNANGYILPYADHIRNVPLHSSDYDIFDYDIPFVQMVLHGLIPYTSEAVNANADAGDELLYAAVTGTPLHYRMMSEDPNVFEDSGYDIYYYAGVEGWAEKAAAEYSMYAPVLRAVSDAVITELERIGDDRFRTVFDNGRVIETDLGKKEIRLDGILVYKADSVPEEG